VGDRFPFEEAGDAANRRFFLSFVKTSLLLGHRPCGVASSICSQLSRGGQQISFYFSTARL
jgi:hypothetical protein